MNKKQRIRYEVQLAKSQQPLGAGRTALINAIRRKYSPGMLSTAQMTQNCLHAQGCDYWN